METSLSTQSSSELTLDRERSRSVDEGHEANTLSLGTDMLRSRSTSESDSWPTPSEWNSGHRLRVPANTFYTRKRAEVGLYIDVDSAAPRARRSVGTPLNYTRSVEDALLGGVAALPPQGIKKHFRRRGMFRGIVVEDCLPGLILALSCETAEGLEALWCDYKRGAIRDAVQELCVTPALLTAVGAVDVRLRTRMFAEELELCRRELEEGEMNGRDASALATRFKDREILRAVKQAQRQLSVELFALKDQVSRFSASSTEFMVTYKRLAPTSTLETVCVSEFKQHLEAAKRSGGFINAEPAERYVSLLTAFCRAKNFIDDSVLQQLDQIHSRCESKKQQALKLNIEKICQQLELFLGDDFNLTKLRHAAWQGNVILREERLFVGLLSLISYCVDFVDSVSHDLDEYMSGFIGDF